MLKIICYTDDTVLIAESENDLQSHVFELINYLNLSIWKFINNGNKNNDNL